MVVLEGGFFEKVVDEEGLVGEEERKLCRNEDEEVELFRVL